MKVVARRNSKRVKNLFKRSRGDETADIGNNIKNI